MEGLGVYVLIVACILAAMVAGLIIAGLTSAANHEEDCPEWVAVTPGPEQTSTWAPCPHRRPCPLHDRNGVRRNGKA